MARARNIKPALFLNEDLVECSIPARYLFVGLWTQADYLGRLENRPKKIKMALLPCDDVDVAALLQELAEYGFIAFYGDEKASNDPGQPFIWITGFQRHQTPHHKEREAGSKLPAPPETSNGQAQGQPEASPEPVPDMPEANRADTLFPLPDSLFPIPDTGLPIPDSPEPEPEPATPKSSSSPDHEQFRLAWNGIAKDCGLLECRSLSPGRRKDLSARFKDKDWRENYPEALERLRDIKWIRGNAQYKPRGIDWFLQPDTLNKVLEGTHDDNKRDYSIPSPDDSAGLF